MIKHRVKCQPTVQQNVIKVKHTKKQFRTHARRKNDEEYSFNSMPSNDKVSAVQVTRRCRNKRSHLAASTTASSSGVSPDFSVRRTAHTTVVVVVIIIIFITLSGIITINNKSRL